MYGDVQEEKSDQANGQTDSERQTFDPDSNSDEPVSVLGDRTGSHSNNKNDVERAAPSNEANSTNQRMNTLRE